MHGHALPADLELSIDSEAGNIVFDVHSKMIIPWIMLQFDKFIKHEHIKHNIT
jgi:hypothetical protein